MGFALRKTARLENLRGFRALPAEASCRFTTSTPWRAYAEDSQGVLLSSSGGQSRRAPLPRQQVAIPWLEPLFAPQA
jgi:hypothetical protein